jgi:hypothetical protein
MKGDPGRDITVADLVEVIRVAPPEQRSRFASEIWSIGK